MVWACWWRCWRSRKRESTGRELLEMMPSMAATAPSSSGAHFALMVARGICRVRDVTWRYFGAGADGTSAGGSLAWSLRRRRCVSGGLVPEARRASSEPPAYGREAPLPGIRLLLAGFDALAAAAVSSPDPVASFPCLLLRAPLALFCTSKAETSTRDGRPRPAPRGGPPGALSGPRLLGEGPPV